MIIKNLTHHIVFYRSIFQMHIGSLPSCLASNATYLHEDPSCVEVEYFTGKKKIDKLAAPFCQIFLILLASSNQLCGTSPH